MFQPGLARMLDEGCTSAPPVTITPIPPRARSSLQAPSRSPIRPSSANRGPIGSIAIRFRRVVRPIVIGENNVGYASLVMVISPPTME
jgi:hypothetical protein